MIVDTLAEETNLVIQRLKLDPGEANYWHSDNCLRFSVVVSGSRLAIEYKDSGDINEFGVHAGMAGWDYPEDRIHRAINKGGEMYEEVVTFYRDGVDVIPQPKFD
jgi:hypothetical protein